MFINSIKNIPSVHSLLEHYHGKSDIEWDFLKKIVQESLVDLKKEVLAGNLTIEKGEGAVPGAVHNKIMDNIAKNETSSLRRVINATGIILHTGLGRAPYCDAAKENWKIVTEDYCNLEFDLDSGDRGERLDHVNRLLQMLTGAEAGIVVNNNAAAVLLLLNTFGKNREVIISRGELVEIGGSFRMPEVMEISGAILKEIGATNRTHFKDYKKAINEQTSMILKVHPSNYRIKGFIKEVEVQDLTELTRENEVLLCYDLGGGALFDLAEVGLPEEPIVSDLVKQDIDLISFSGDKLVGGPQCGIIVGKKELVDQLHKNPMYRALRLDKGVIAVLEATLKTFINKDITNNELYRRNNQDPNILKARGQKILDAIRFDRENAVLEVIDSPVQIGSGALPVENIPSCAIRFRFDTYPAEKLARYFRLQEIPVVGYIKEKHYMWNLKTIREADVDYLSQCINRLVEEL